MRLDCGLRMDDPKLIGKRIQQARRRKGLTQLQLAVAAQITNASVSRLENGVQVPRSGTALRLAKALDVDVVDLVGSTHVVEKTQLETIGDQLARVELKLDQIVKALGADQGETVIALPALPKQLRPSGRRTPSAD